MIPGRAPGLATNASNATGVPGVARFITDSRGQTALAFDQIVQAHRYLESDQQFGKVVVTV